MPPAAEAIEHADAPTGGLAAALQVPEVAARIAAAAPVLFVGRTATAAGLAAADADPMAASAPLVDVIIVGADVLENSFARNLSSKEQRPVLLGGDRIDTDCPR